MQKPIDINFDYSKVKGSVEMHNKFKKEFMVAVSKKFPDVMVIPYDVLVARAFINPDIIVRAGQAGTLDTIILGNKSYLFFDMKTGSAVMQKNQINFQTRIREINLGNDRAFKITSISQGFELIGQLL